MEKSTKDVTKEKKKTRPLSKERWFFSQNASFFPESSKI
jgi:hypothetical protein|tara:strand:+ start:400 stop:516 length:117 start_codon:yes stop_codon:yes gene_type:complete